MANLEKVSMKLLVDKEKNRVVFAESDKDFVDIILSFLTLPLGTIIRITGKKSSLGCFNRLYESIENLDKDFLETEACKNMLLQPRSVSEVHCEDLKINVNDLKPRGYYRCKSSDCYTRTSRAYCSVPGARCSCRNPMDFVWERHRLTSIAHNKDGVFVRGGANIFLVTDDFQVLEAGSDKSLAIISKLGNKNSAVLERRDITIGKEEICSLLERSLQSSIPLSDVFLGQVKANNAEEMKGKELMIQSKERSDAKWTELKALVNKDNEEVLYAEANEDFINFLFSFLAFPIGSIVKLFGGQTSLVCVDNLYMSVMALCENSESIKSEECTNLLLNSKIAPHFGCDDQILKIDQMLPVNFHFESGLVISPVNPKLPAFGTKEGGRFVKGISRFMVIGDLMVMPMSYADVPKLCNKAGVPIASLEERIIKLGEVEARNILKASLITDN